MWIPSYLYNQNYIMMKLILYFITISFLSLNFVESHNQILANVKPEQPLKSLEVPVSSNFLSKCMKKAWNVSWKRFYSPKTDLFYDYLISYKPGQELSHLPTADEISRLYPNNYGYDTGMEDCMISAGVMLCMIVDQYAVTGNENLRKSAYSVFRGIKNCATVHGVPGFLARGVCVEDRKSTYIGSSRDQYTHAVHGLWYYYHSPLCNSETKIEIGEILSSIADRMKQYVTPENDYDFMMADGTHDPRGISRMWNVKGHEAARLPMIYAAAWNTTGKKEYYDLYQKYLKPAIEQSFDVDEGTPTYCFVQMQCSLELLQSLKQDTEMKDKMSEIMSMVSKRASVRAINANRNASELDLTMLTSDWRTGGGIKPGSEYRKVWYCVRESGEAALSQLMNISEPFHEDQKSLLLQAITRLDYNRVSTSGIFYLQGAYWKARLRGIF
jgi:hypothetical protein